MKSKVLCVVGVAAAWAALRAAQIGMPKGEALWTTIEVVRWGILAVGVLWATARILRLEERMRVAETRLHLIGQTAEMHKLDLELDQMFARGEAEPEDRVTLE